tara:strand:+ start:1590 stop:1772 length:183 start_codon:yes stop_codon:yes gene_type:complete
MRFKYMKHNSIEKAHNAAEEAAKGFGFSSYAELNESVDEQAKEAARAAFDEALLGCQQEV